MVSKDKWKDYYPFVNFLLVLLVVPIIILMALYSLLLALTSIVLTTYDFLALAYAAWIWYDRETPHRNSRRLEWVRNLSWWKYIAEYFPVKLVNTANLDPSKNYLFCCYPHGILPTGICLAMSTNALDFEGTFPGFNPCVVSRTEVFYLPFLRDLFLSSGGYANSEKGLTRLLRRESGGNIVALPLGGADEILNCRPGDNTIILKNRRGYARIALKTGSPLVPVYSFGETDIFNQLPNAKGSLLRLIQDKVKQLLGFPLIFCYGYLPNGTPMPYFPSKRPITVVVGEPIEVPKVVDPTQEQIEDLHNKFTESVQQLFDTYKLKCLSNKSPRLVIT